MKNYPIVFGLRDFVQGRGFLAGVSVNGRALMHEEDDGSFWIEGVQPGGFSAVGTGPADALEDFRRSYRAVLFDIASDAPTFRDFEAGVNEFFHGSSPKVAREWEEAVEDVRAGRTEADWLAKKPAGSPPTIQVQLVKDLSVENNQVEEGAAVAA